MDIKDMTLDEKIGQMIIAGFPSKYYDHHIMKLVEEYKVGNINLFSRNIGSLIEVAELTYDIQKNMVDNIGIPAFIGIDQEGGMVSRIHEGATLFPGNMSFSAACIDGCTLQEGRIIGEELRALGVNLDLAPVLDVNNNPKNPIIGVRSYGDNPERVAQLGLDFINGLQSRGVAATAKHFPGHGDTSIDTHIGMPSVDFDLKRLEQIELFPFKQAVYAGVDAVMTAHIIYSAFEDKKLPATLSYNVLTKLLRENMGFKGIIITDCMEMDAIISNFGIEKASVMAVEAGADMLCISHHLDVQIKGIDAVKKAVIDGRISEERIDKSVMRILAAKEKYNLFKNPYPDIDKIKNKVGCPEHLNFARDISEKSITLVRDSNHLIPLAGKKIVSISTEPALLTGAEDESKKKFIFCETVKNRFGGDSFIIPLNPDDDMCSRIVQKSMEADRIVIALYNAGLNQGQSELINRIRKLGDKTIAVSLRNPYDVSLFSGISTCICTYEYTQLSVNSILKVLSGNIQAQGKLPVIVR